MSTICAPALSHAEQHAHQNWRANDAALAKMQPALAGRLTWPESLEWVYARDGYLSARDSAGRWHSGCSLPMRTAQTMFRNLACGGTTACVLAPAHAAQVRFLLDRLLPLQQALIVVIPDADAAAVTLCCDDFSAHMARRRLWLAAGADWPDQLQHILSENPGLSTPQQLIRTGLADDEELQLMVSRAQGAIHQENARRAAVLQDISRRPRYQTGQVRNVCLLTGSRFSLWNDAGAVLASTLADNSSVCWQTLDCDAPTSTSHLGLALAAAECDAIVAANLGRTDLPGLVSADRPWITWITGSRIPLYSPDAASDGLLLVDPILTHAAKEAGWPGPRVAVGTWPAEIIPPHGGESFHLAIIADTVDVATPRQPFDLSTHQLLWELIRDEVLTDPFVLNDDPATYLIERIRRLSVDPSTVDTRLFMEALILPAYHQGLARALMHEGIPFLIWGESWNGAGDLSSHWAGPIRSREELRRAVAGACGLVHVWPWPHAHPVQAFNRPIVRRPRTRADLVAAALRAVDGRLESTTKTAPAVSAHSILKLLQP